MILAALINRARWLLLGSVVSVAVWPAPAAQPRNPAAASSAAPAVAAGAPAGVVTDTWRGYTRHHFTVDGLTAWIVEPRVAAPGRPWTWCMEFPDAFTERTGVPQLLERGFHHVYIKVGNTFGSPAALRHFDAFYRILQDRGLAKKAVLIGISRGGLYAYNWAALNPEKVAAIYGDAPVGDFKSWPGGKGLGKGSPKDWAALQQHYGFQTEGETLAYTKNPVDQLAPLARAKIPLLHVVGDADDVVPVEENTAVIERRYRELGGHMIVVHKPGGGHHPHGLDDPTPVVAFILKHAGADVK
jgi:dienelactone hydrolase